MQSDDDIRTQSYILIKNIKRLELDINKCNRL
jgi:hypothetical protein